MSFENNDELESRIAAMADIMGDELKGLNMDGYKLDAGEMYLLIDGISHLLYCRKQLKIIRDREEFWEKRKESKRASKGGIEDE